MYYYKPFSKRESILRGITHVFIKVNEYRDSLKICSRATLRLAPGLNLKKLLSAYLGTQLC